MAQPFSWIEIRNQTQLEWVGGYIARKSGHGSTVFSSLNYYADHGHREMAKSLKALPDEAEYREASRQMKGAWNTYQYRKKNGNPISLQISKSCINQLNTLASKNGQSQVGMLSDLINGATEHQNNMKNRESFLLEILSNEIHNRCCLELSKKSAELKLTNEDVIKIYKEILEERFSDIEKMSKELVLTLKPLMKERMRGVEYVFAYIPEDLI